MDSCSKTVEEQERFCSRVMDWVNQGDGYARTSHIRVTYMGDGYAKGELAIGPDVLNPRGMVHGGALTALADTVSGVAAHSGGLGCVTLSSNMNYLRPAYGSRIFCAARVQKKGRTVQVCEVTLTDDREETVATGIFTFYGLGPLQMGEDSGPSGTGGKTE